MSASVTWRGMSEALTKLATAQTMTDKSVHNVVKNATEKTKANAKEKAPVDTGFMKAHIKTSYPAQKTGEVRSEAGYSGFVEYGTRYMSDQPFMKPALEEAVEEYKSDLLKAMKGAFK
ncbi:HK97-gp10 family putative phage morphogenesis protein [Streptococcus sp. H31]|uniref:HK97-gp10 family putative phage morphogenesis protein n=1 Tax=Streptococcus huangxiaojuni TaxID=3237239 RepID=UPI0034A44EA5